MRDNQDETYYALALQLVPGIGEATIRHLLSQTRSFEKIFRCSLEELDTFQLRNNIKDAIQNFSNWNMVDAQYENLEKEGIQTITLLDENFPRRLLMLENTPSVLFYKGKVEFNAQYMLSFVGTRNNTSYGKGLTEKLIGDLAYLKPTIVSGLAVGIDIIAHRSALDHGLPTIAVVAHGLHTIYPPNHRAEVLRMQKNGGVVSHYWHGTPSIPANFADRNRVIAALGDATIVVESGQRGGSMITAEHAFGYGREVLAPPGRTIDSRSEGPNYLIKTLKASLITSADDITYVLGWDAQKKKRPVVQKNLFVDLTEEEVSVIAILKNEEKHIDAIMHGLELSMPKISAILVQLELKGIVKVLPGKVYRVVS